MVVLTMLRFETSPRAVMTTLREGVDMLKWPVAMMQRRLKGLDVGKCAGS